MDLIALRNLHLRFLNKVVLRGLDLTVRKGETMVIIGRSGEGKSVTLKCIMGLLEPSAGKVIFDGQDVFALGERARERIRQQIGMLFQGAALFDSLTVEENVSFGLRRLTDYGEHELRNIVRQKLAMVGLKHVEHLKPAELSGGMKKRVALARAIAMNPGVILYDEPTTGVDPIMADAINELIIDMKEKLHVTSIAVTHDMVSAYKIADRIALLHEGRIVDVGTPTQIRQSRNPLVHQFITGSAKGPISII